MQVNTLSTNVWTSILDVKHRGILSCHRTARADKIPPCVYKILFLITLTKQDHDKNKDLIYTGTVCSIEVLQKINLLFLEIWVRINQVLQICLPLPTSAHLTQPLRARWHIRHYLSSYIPSIFIATKFILFYERVIKICVPEVKVEKHDRRTNVRCVYYWSRS